MKFGVLHLFESPMGRSDEEMVGEQISLMQAAEDYGKITHENAAALYRHPLPEARVP